MLAAARAGLVEAMATPVDRGADIKAGDDHGMRVLHFALLAGQHSSALFLIQQRCNVNARDEGGDTPLIMAARKGMVEMVEKLVAAGAEVEAVNYQGRWAIDYAILEKQEAVAHFLLQRDPPYEVNASDVCGRTRSCWRLTMGGWR